MNKRTKQLIMAGVLSMCVIAPVNANAMESENIDGIQNMVEIRDANGDVINIDNIKYELIDVEIEDAQTLIDSGLLDEDYKEQMLVEHNLMRGSKDTTVYFEHPVKHTVAVTGAGNGGVAYTATATATMTANLDQKLKVSISLSNIVAKNGYSVSKNGSPSNGKYVSKGQTSVATQKMSVSKSGNIVISTHPTFKALHRSIVQGNAQVAFGIGTTLSW